MGHCPHDYVVSSGGEKVVLSLLMLDLQNHISDSMLIKRYIKLAAWSHTHVIKCPNSVLFILPARKVKGV